MELAPRAERMRVCACGPTSSSLALAAPSSNSTSTFTMRRAPDAPQPSTVFGIHEPGSRPRLSLMRQLVPASVDRPDAAAGMSAAASSRASMMRERLRIGEMDGAETAVRAHTESMTRGGGASSKREGGFGGGGGMLG